MYFERSIRNVRLHEMAVRPLHPPQLDAAPPDDYEMPLSLLEGELTSEMAADYEKAREFTAIHAFLLGLRTGRGLPL